MVAFVGVALALLAAVAIAAQVIFVRIGTEEGDPLDVLAVVLAISTFFVAAIAILVHYPTYRLTTTATLAFAGAGLTGTFLGMIAYYASIQRLGASRTEPLKASMPLYATLFAVLLLGEDITTGNLAGVVLIVAGVAVISWESRSNSVADVKDTPWTLALPLLAAVLFGVEPILAKVGLAEGTPPMVGLAVKTVVALAALVGYLAWRGSLSGLAGRVSHNRRWYLAAAVSFTVFLIAFYLGLEAAPVVVVIPIFQSSPLFVILLSAVFLRQIERVTPRLVAGAAVVIVGATVVTIYG